MLNRESRWALQVIIVAIAVFLAAGCQPPLSPSCARVTPDGYETCRPVGQAVPR